MRDKPAGPHQGEIAIIVGALGDDSDLDGYARAAAITRGHRWIRS